jgi:hypothetical protein
MLDNGRRTTDDRQQTVDGRRQTTDKGCDDVMM